MNSEIKLECTSNGTLDSVDVPCNGQNIKLELKTEYTPAAFVDNTHIKQEFKEENELIISDATTIEHPQQQMQHEEWEYQQGCEYEATKRFKKEVSYGDFIITEEYDDDADFENATNDSDYNPNFFNNDEDDSEDDMDDDTATCSSFKAEAVNKTNNSLDVILNDKSLRQNCASIQCHLCKQIFSYCYIWTRHLNVKHSDFMADVRDNYDHLSENYEVCKICKIKVRYPSNQAIHFLLNHAHAEPVPLLRCKICKYEDFRLSSLQQHNNEEHVHVNEYSNTCPLCSLSMKDKSKLQHHIMEKHSREFQEKFIYHCHLCDHSNFGSNQEIYFKHLENEHQLNSAEVLQFTPFPEAGEQVDQCTKCLMLFTNVNLHILLEHYLSHNNRAFWHCKYCKRKLIFQDKNNMHLCSHMMRPNISKLPLLRGETEPSASKKVKMRKNIRKSIFDNCQKIEQPTNRCQESVPKHELVANAPDKNSCKNKDQDIEIVCSLCNLQFPEQLQIIDHFEVKHNNFKEFFSSNDKAATCKICQSSIKKVDRCTLVSHFVQHLHQKPYKCNKCQRSCSQLSKCVAHIRKYHEETNTSNKERKHSVTKQSTSEYEEFIGFACPECNESMTTRSSWEVHIKQQHNFFESHNLAVVDTSSLKHKCRECNTVLPTIPYWQQQHKLTHMPYKVFKCLLCHFRVNRMNNLERHINERHFLKGTFTCPVCPIISSTAYEMSQHIRRTHPPSDCPINMCTLCFIEFKNLKKHMESHGAVKYSDR